MAVSSASGVGFGDTTSAEIPRESRRKADVVGPIAATRPRRRFDESDAGAPDARPSDIGR